MTVPTFSGEYTTVRQATFGSKIVHHSFMKLPTTTTTNPKILRKIIDGADECLRGLSAINIKERDPWLIFILLNKLDAETRHNWFEHVGSRTSITIEEFLKFLGARFIHLESNELHTTGVTVRNTSVRSHVTAATSGSSCAFCNGQHNIAKCTDFMAASISDRRKQVRSKSICFNCLKAGHRVKDCKSNFSCRTCHAKYHTLLHESTDKESKSDLCKNTYHTNGNDISLQSTPDDALASHYGLQGMHSMQVVLPTAKVLVRDASEHIHKLRALIDTGSQVSFISETCVQRIGVSRSEARLNIKGISSSEAGTTKGCVNLAISSQLDNSNVSVCAYILQRITADIPKHSISNIPWKKISSLKLADSNFNQSAPIDFLLGADIAWNIITDGKIQIEKPNLFAINSIFGWILSGQVDIVTREDAISSYTATINVDKLLTRFWELDECKPVSKQSDHDDPAEIHFRETHTRSTDGKYVVELPFKGKDLTFTNTLQGAVQRLNSMERRFHHNKQLKQEYAKFMNEYMTLGHMQQIPLEDIDKSPHYYLPHHAILKPESSTTKLRVVFDGSHQDAVGKSLNGQLLVGPPIQRDLFGVSLRFRQFKYVFVADITKMFRQIWVSPFHQDYQRIVWRESPDEPIKHYWLSTVTYGTASAPFLSVRVLQQLAMDNINNFPHAANIICNNIYVDDVMACGDSIDAVINLKTELVNLLESGGFHLRKWSSNSTAVLQTVPAEDCEAFSKHKNGGSDYIKILGLYWNPKPDKYSFHVGTPTLRHSREIHAIHLEHKELQKARYALFRAIQQESFEDTFRRLKTNSHKRDKLMQLSPFIDPEGVLRVGGRIERATLSYNIKHPIILPKHHVSRLIVEDLPKMYLHVGVNELFVIVRQRYWIIGARNIIRSVVYQCKQCFILRKQTSAQRMADLPAVRLEPARAFLNSGCDFAGPINIKMTN
ncbi:PREDICTED: uncharacterized protein LOC108373331, partial [Rhagoletis zephyria]|uniref:uncharacterized protein LOC108373331 n=1 Tax=Rhagoletis zephyria TaxID=28612 RepID=UPI00081135C5